MDRKLNLIIGVSRTDTKTIINLNKQMRKLSKEIGVFIGAANRLNTMTANVTGLNKYTEAIHHMATATNNASASMQNIKTGTMAKSLEVIKANAGSSSKSVKELTEKVNESSKSASKASQANSELTKEQVRLALSSANAIRAATRKNKTDKESLQIISRKIIASSKSGEVDVRSAKNVRRLSDAMVLRNAVTNQNIKTLETLNLTEEQLNANGEEIIRNYREARKATNDLLESTNRLAKANKKLTESSSRATQEQIKKAKASIRVVNATTKRNLKIRDELQLLGKQIKAANAAGDSDLRLSKRVLALRQQYILLNKEALRNVTALRKSGLSSGQLGSNVQALVGDYRTSTGEVRKQTTELLKNAKASVALNDAQKQQGSSLNNMVSGFQRVIGTQIKYFLSTLLVFGAVRKLQEAFQSIFDLSDQTARVFAVSRSSVLLLEERFIALGYAIEDAAVKTGKSIQDVSEILFQFGSAGLQAEESLSALNSTLDLLQATDADIATTTKTVVGIYRLLGNTLDDVGDQTAKFARINDVIAATYRDNQVEISDFTQAMKFALPTAKQLGLTLEETSGVIAHLHNNMIRGGEAGRALRVIFSRMSTNMDEFSEAFGVAIDPNKPLDFLDIMQQVSKRLKDGALTADQVSNVFERLGLRGANAFVIMAQQVDRMNDTISELRDNSKGAAKTMADLRRESDIGQLKIFGENLLRILRVAIAPLGIALIQIIKLFNKFFESIKDTAIEKLLAGIVAVISTLTILIATIAIVTKLWPILTSAMVAMKAASIALSGSFAGLSTGIKAVGASLTTSLGIYAAIIAIIAAMAYGIYKLINYNKELLESNEELINKLDTEIKERKNHLNSLDETISKVEEINDAYKNGLVTYNQTRVAIANAVKSHNELGLAASISSGNIEKFTIKAKEQRDAIDALIKSKKKLKNEKIEESFIAARKEIEKLSVQYKYMSPIVDRLNKNYKNYIDNRKKDNITSLKYKQTMKDLSERMSVLRNKAEKLQGGVGELATKTDLSGTALGEINVQINKLILGMDAATGKIKKFGSAFSFVERSAENLSVLPFRDKVEELGRFNEKFTGIGKFFVKVLYDYDFVAQDFNTRELEEEIQKKVNNSLDRITNIRYRLDSINLSSIDNVILPEFEIDEALIKEQSDYFSNVLEASLNDALKDIDLTEVTKITIDDKKAIDSLKAVAKNADLIKDGFKDPQSLIEFSKNLEVIKALEEDIVDQLEKYIKNEDQRKSAIAGVVSEIGNLTNASALYAEIQQRIVVTTTAFVEQTKAYKKIVDETAAISLNTTKNLDKDIKVSKQKLILASQAYDIASLAYGLELSRTDNDAKPAQLLKERQKAQKTLTDATKEEAENRLAIINHQNQVNLSVIAGQDALNKSINFGQDRISQLRAEEINQIKINSQRIKYLNSLSEGIKLRIKNKEIDIKGGFILKEQQLIAAERNKIAAKTASIQRKINEEIFKQSIAVAKTINSSNELINNGDKRLVTINKISIINLKIARQQELVRKTQIKITKSKQGEFKLGNELIQQQKELSKLETSRLKESLNFINIQSDLEQKYILQAVAIDNLNLKLLTTNSLFSELTQESLQFNISQRQLAVESEKINKLLKERELLRISGGDFDEAGLQKINTSLIKQGNILADVIIREENKLKNIRKQQLKLVDSINSGYQKQTTLIGGVATTLEEALQPLLAFDFDQRPFTSIAFAAKALNRNFLEIVNVSPQQIIKDLSSALRDGTLDFRVFRGEARELARNISELGEQERALRAVQESIRKQKFSSSIELINSALKSKNITAATQAFDRLSNSMEVLDPRSGEIDIDATNANIKIMNGLAEKLSVAYDDSSKSIENNLSTARGQLGDISEIINNIANTIDNLKFGDNFVTQMNKVISSLKELSNTKFVVSVANVAIPSPVLHRQAGGDVPGVGSGDIVPAMLEPGEFVIPKKIVNALGVNYFRDMIGERYKNGGSVGIRGYQEGGSVEGFSIPGIDELANQIKSLSIAIVENGKITSDETTLVEFGDKVASAVNQSIDEIKSLSISIEENGKITSDETTLVEFGDKVSSAVNNSIPGIGDEVASAVYESLVLIGFGKDVVSSANDQENEIKTLIDTIKLLAPLNEARERELQELSIPELTDFIATLKEFEAKDELIDTIKLLAPLNEERGIELQDLSIPELNDFIAILKEFNTETKNMTLAMLSVTDSPISAFKTGGTVPGIGVGDIVPAMLEPGEYVIPKDVVNKLGVPFFDRMISRKYQNGSQGGVGGSGSSVRDYTHIQPNRVIIDIDSLIEESKKINKNLEDISKEQKNTEDISKEQKNTEDSKKLVKSDNLNDISKKAKESGRIIDIGNIIPSVNKSIDVFKKSVSSANKEVVKLINNMFDAFGPKIREIIKLTSNEFTRLFSETLPNLFGGFLDSFIKTQVDIQKQIDETANSTTDSFLESRADLVEQLKRNEISYFDYFNSLEDLNADTNDSIAQQNNDAEQQRVAAIASSFKQMTEAILQETNRWIDAFDTFFKKGVDGFVEFGTKIADSLDEVFGFIGNLAEVGISALAGGGGGLAGLAGAAVGATGGSVVPGAGTAIGAGAGLAIGSVVGGAIGSTLKGVLPIVGDILVAFEEVATSAVKGILDIIPYIIELGSMTDEEFKALVTTLQTMPETIDKFVTAFKDRLPLIVDEFEDKIPEIATAIIDAFSEVIDTIVDELPTITDIASKEFIKFFTSIAATMPDLFDSAFDAISKSFETILDSEESVGKLGKTIIESIASIFESSSSNFVKPITDSIVKAFNDEGSTIVKTIADSISTNLPIIIQAAIEIIKAVVAVFSDPTVQDAIKEASLKLVESFITAILDALPGAKAFVSVIGLVVFAITGLAAAIVALLSSSLIPFLIMVGSIAAPIIAINVAAAALIGVLLVVISPLIALIGALGLLVAAIGYLAVIKPVIDFFVFIGDVIDEVGSKIKENAKIQTAVLRIQEAFDDLSEAFANLLSVFGVNDFGNIAESVANGIIKIIEVMLIFVEPIIKAIEIITEATKLITKLTDSLQFMARVLEWIDDALVGHSVVPSLVLFNIALEILDGILAQVRALVDNLVDSFLKLMEPIKTIGDVIQNTLVAAFNSLLSVINNIVSVIPNKEDVVSDVKENVNNARSNLQDAGNALSSGDVGGAIESIADGISSIFKFHNGGIFNNAGQQKMVSQLGLNSDEGVGILRNNEGILTARGVNAAGGAGAISALNSGADLFSDPNMLYSRNASEIANNFKTTFGVDSAIQSGGTELTTTDPGSQSSGEGGTTIIKEETTIEVNIDMSGANFTGEDVAEKVEEALSNSFQNREGQFYVEISNLTDKKRSDGIRKRK